MLKNNIHIGIGNLSDINDVAELITTIAKDCDTVKKVIIDFEIGSITIVEDDDYRKCN